MTKDKFQVNNINSFFKLDFHEFPVRVCHVSKPKASILSTIVISLVFSATPFFDKGMCLDLSLLAKIVFSICGFIAFFAMQIYIRGLFYHKAEITIYDDEVKISEQKSKNGSKKIIYSKITDYSFVALHNFVIRDHGWPVFLEPIPKGGSKKVFLKSLETQALNNLEAMNEFKFKTVEKTEIIFYSLKDNKIQAIPLGIFPTEDYKEYYAFLLYVSELFKLEMGMIQDNNEVTPLSRSDVDNLISKFE